MATLETEANRIKTTEIGAIKEWCQKIEVENLNAGRCWPRINEELEKIPELERQVRVSKEKLRH